MDKLLKVSGILLIITGGISFYWVFGNAALAALGLPGILILGLVISLIGAAASLIVEISVKNSARPEKAKTCMVFGIIVLNCKYLLFSSGRRW